MVAVAWVVAVAWAVAVLVAVAWAVAVLVAVAWVVAVAVAGTEVAVSVAGIVVAVAVAGTTVAVAVGGTPFGFVNDALAEAGTLTVSVVKVAVFVTVCGAVAPTNTWKVITVGGAATSGR